MFIAKVACFDDEYIVTLRNMVELKELLDFMYPHGLMSDSRELYLISIEPKSFGTVRELKEICTH